ncbi:MAG: ATP-dependent zinc protease, partial [Verrucomicrobiota bacterium]
MVSFDRMKKPPKPEVIGWKETIDLPDWGIQSLIAKSDTGARRSALDVRNIVELPGGRVRFDIVLDRKNRSLTKTVVAPIAHQTHVRSSNGQQHERYFVTTRVRIGHRIKEVEFSLTCRKSMVCRILLGRKALEGDFLVDSSQKHVIRPRRKVRVADERP